MFAIKVYVPHFIISSIGYKKLLKFRSTDSEIAEEGLKTLSRHLWYLNPVTVQFALFSDKVEQDTKSRRAARLLSVRSQVQPNSKLKMNIPNHEGEAGSRPGPGS